MKRLNRKQKRKVTNEQVVQNEQDVQKAEDVEAFFNNELIERPLGISTAEMLAKHPGTDIKQLHKQFWAAYDKCRIGPGTNMLRDDVRAQMHIDTGPMAVRDAYNYQARLKVFAEASGILSQTLAAELAEQIWSPIPVVSELQTKNFLSFNEPTEDNIAILTELLNQLQVPGTDEKLVTAAKTRIIEALTPILKALEASTLIQRQYQIPILEKYANNSNGAAQPGPQQVELKDKT